MNHSAKRRGSDLNERVRWTEAHTRVPAATSLPRNLAKAGHAASSRVSLRVLPYFERSEERQNRMRNTWRIALSLVVGTGVDPVTSRFSGARSTN
jgi:hypothetical protein